MASNNTVNRADPGSSDKQLISVSFKHKIATIEIFCPTLSTWTLLKYISTSKFAHFSSIFYNGDLLFLGGFCRTKRICVNSVSSINLYKRKCKKIKPTLTYRQMACTVEVDGLLYYFGGKDKDGNLFDLVECWDPKIGMWDFVAPMDDPAFEFAAIEFNGRLYAAGGLCSDSSCKNTMSYYDPKKNTWTQCAAMMVERAYFSLAILNNFIYAIGGFNPTLGCLKMVERYNPITDTWMQISSLNYSRNCLSAAVVAGRLLAIAGTLKEPVGVVEEYDPVLDVWTQQNSKITRGRCISMLVEKLKKF